MIFLRVLHAFVVSLFSTKRAASPHCRETVFLSLLGVRNFYSLILSSVFSVLFFVDLVLSL
jgi:hypothetical protein